MPDRSTPSTFDGNGDAGVIGGSMAGLLAARVLSNHFECVRPVERGCWFSPYPSGPDPSLTLARTQLPTTLSKAGKAPPW